MKNSIESSPLTTRVHNSCPRPSYTPERIDSLQPDEVFVFGSNLAGNHLGGAAKIAHMKFGAIMGAGTGHQGQSYAIPTMQGGVETIRPYVEEFTKYAQLHSELFFYVTRIGCGIAGFRDEEIAPLFATAATLGNVCLPASFASIIKTLLPQEIKSIMYGQLRTLVDLLKALNDDRPVTDAYDAGHRLEELIMQNVRYGDEYAFMAVRALHHIIRHCQDNENGIDIEKIEQKLQDFWNSRFSDIDNTITEVFYRYSANKLVKYIQYLNDFRRYSDYSQILEDLPSIRASHCSSNDEEYYYSFNNFALHDLTWIMSTEWDNISRNGRLDNDALEEIVFGRYEKALKEHGLRELIQLAYSEVGCHPNLRGTNHHTNRPIYGPYFRIDGNEIEKGCSDFRRWPYNSECFEMRFAQTILDKDPNYILVSDESGYNQYYIPGTDDTLPVYSREMGKMKFSSPEEKQAFIKKYR